MFLVLVFGNAEQLAYDAIMQVDNFVNDHGGSINRKRDQRRVTLHGLKLGQIGRSHLRAIASQLE